MADDPLVALVERLHERCLTRGVSLVTVESCTGGLVGHLITETPGASAWYVGGFVTYSDVLKRDLVDVPPSVLAAHGAVSAQTALAMELRKGAPSRADVTNSSTHG